MASSKLGRNPLHQKRKTAVKPLIQDQFHQPSPEPAIRKQNVSSQPQQNLGFFERLQQMDIKLDVQQVLGRLKLLSKD